LLPSFGQFDFVHDSRKFVGQGGQLRLEFAQLGRGINVTHGDFPNLRRAAIGDWLEIRRAIVACKHNNRSGDCGQRYGAGQHETRPLGREKTGLR
jgi:hypothetical protein